jgi:hypothetical protein
MKDKAKLIGRKLPSTRTMRRRFYHEQADATVVRKPKRFNFRRPCGCSEPSRHGIQIEIAVKHDDPIDSVETMVTCNL